MAHSHHEYEQGLYHRRGCIICDIIHRLFILEGEVDTMSQAWEEQESRFARDVSELKSKFDTLNTKVNELTSQVDSTEATQAAEYAADFKSSLDSFEASFGLGSSDAGGGTPSDTPPASGGSDTGGTPAQPPATGEDVTAPEPPAGGEGEVTDPNSPAASTGGDTTTPDPSVGGQPLPGEPDQAPTTPAVGGGNIGAPSEGQPGPAPDSPQPPQDSPGSDPTIPVPGSE